MLCSLTTRWSEPPNVMDDPTATLGPSAPHLFLGELSAKCACTGNGDVVCVKMTYWVGVIVKDRSSLSNLVTLPVTVMYGFVSMFASPSKGMSL